MKVHMQEAAIISKEHAKERSTGRGAAPGRPAPCRLAGLSLADRVPLPPNTASSPAGLGVGRRGGAPDAIPEPTDPTQAGRLGSFARL
jgi:hypothetical protein